MPQPDTGSNNNLAAREEQPKALVVFRAFLDGKMTDELCEEFGIPEDKIEKVIEEGRTMEEVRLNHDLQTMRLKAEIENENFRQRARRRLDRKALQALENLLEGESVVVERRKDTGEVILHPIHSPQVMAQGLEHYRKTTSLEQKPAPAPNTVINLQNNVGDGAGATNKFDFESTLKKIREQQLKTAPDNQVIDVEPEGESPWEKDF